MNLSDHVCLHLVKSGFVVLAQDPLGGKPVLVTPMERKQFKKDGTIELLLD